MSLVSPFSTPAFSRTAVVDGKRVYLLAVARIQRTLIVIVMSLVACYGAALVGMVATETFGLGEIGLRAAVMGSVFLAFALSVAGIVQSVRLSIASGMPITGSLLCGLLMLVPIVGPILLVLVNTNATSLLNRNGVPVGFFGVTKQTMRTLVLGACPDCGYDVRGLPQPLCPECGATLPHAPAD
ncbi:MAG: hypothetical protein QM783_17835 [Phycisphaerales bacterium]